MPVGWYRPTRHTERTSRVYSLPATFGAGPRSWYGRSAKAATRRSRSTGSFTVSKIAPLPVQRDRGQTRTRHGRTRTKERQRLGYGIYGWDGINGYVPCTYTTSRPPGSD